MQMSFEDFECPPERTLSEAQERRLNRLYLGGDLGSGRYSTVESLVRLGFIEIVDRSFQITESGTHYCFHHSINMPI